MIENGQDLKLDSAFSVEKISYTPNFLSKEFSKRLYQELLTKTHWEQPELTLFGRKCLTPRLVGFVGDEGISYQYSGHRHFAQQWPSMLLSLRGQVETQLNESFNSALCNLYRNGQDYMGWHSDDESALGENPCVASISLGAERDFKIRKKSSSETYTLLLESSSLLVMERGFQEEWQHALPKRLRSEDARLNITFRDIQGFQAL